MYFVLIYKFFQVPVQALLMVFLVLSDIMALHFFFLIRTEGSWLDIGTSLSHYVISMATTVFLMLLMQLAKFLTTYKIPGFVSNSEALPEVLPRVNLRPHRD